MITKKNILELKLFPFVASWLCVSHDFLRFINIV